MTEHTLYDVPATALKVMAQNLENASYPVRIRNNDVHASLAAGALWTFAKQTGLDRDSESLVTVLTDFLGDLLHLCEQFSPDSSGEKLLRESLKTALMHFEQENDERLF
ncbi:MULTISPECIES: hypothetical protein [Citrobacter]|uniref:hypothetical protein n=1 Tax=Citrobacter TaxID=544 RepID=UPI001C0B1C6A|nr:hypothetical protein [Citrobacter youngae]MBU3800079.1 hypothetical protein [Citrobacter youngae]